MKEIHKLLFKNDCRYSTEHTWAKKEKSRVVIGISDYAQEQLGEIIFVQLPDPGDTFARKDEFGFIESAKSVSDLYIPVAGKVVSVNDELDGAPEKINQDPFKGGWLIRITPDNQKDLESLMTADEYKKHISGEELA